MVGPHSAVPDAAERQSVTWRRLTRPATEVSEGAALSPSPAVPSVCPACLPESLAPTVWSCLKALLGLTTRP